MFNAPDAILKDCFSKRAAGEIRYQLLHCAFVACFLTACGRLFFTWHRHHDFIPHANKFSVSCAFPEKGSSECVRPPEKLRSSDRKCSAISSAPIQRVRKVFSWRPQHVETCRLRTCHRTWATEAKGRAGKESGGKDVLFAPLLSALQATSAHGVVDGVPHSCESEMGSCVRTTFCTRLGVTRSADVH